MPNPLNKPTGNMLDAAGTALPLAAGSASAGMAIKYAREDHVHPTSDAVTLTGDVTKSAGNTATTVAKINGRPVSSTLPINGQVLTWDGDTWVPGAIATGGSGGGGLQYYFNGNTAADSPTANLPATPVELGRVGDTVQTTITSAPLSTTAYTLVMGFVSDVLDPNVTAIPAGLFDFNIWMSSDANAASQTILQIKIYKYNGVNAPTLLATSDDVSIYDPTVIAQYIISVVVPQTTVLATDRLYIELLGKATQNNKIITIKTGGATPSHLHTTIPSVGGSGLVKVVNGVMQNPASKLVNSDVAADAAIAQSKISGLTEALTNVPAVAGTIYEFFEQFFATTPLTGNLVFGVTGGANAAANTGFGVVSMSTGSTAAANQQSRLTQGTNAQIIGAASARAIFSVGQNGATWFDGTLTGAFRCGWGDSITGESANGIMFRVQNSQSIEFVTRASNLETVTTTGVSFSNGTLQRLEILINSAGTEIVAKIDGVVVATHTTRIPSGRLIFFSHINRTAATGTAVIANIDFVYLRVTPNTPFF